MRDQKTENFLNECQAKWQYVERVDFSEIDMKASEENPARSDRRLDQERALSYGLAMLNGVEFPALVLLNHPNPTDKVKWIVSTGMHRIEGARCADRNYFDAYCVTEADAYKREYINRMLNSIEGRGMTVNEVINHLLWLHENFPSNPLTELAKGANLKPGIVQNAFNEHKAKLRARKFNYDFDRAKLPQKSCLLLGSIHSDVVFEKACDVACMIPGVTSNDVSDMVREVRKARDEKAQEKTAGLRETRGLMVKPLGVCDGGVALRRTRIG